MLGNQIGSFLDVLSGMLGYTQAIETFSTSSRKETPMIKRIRTALAAGLVVLAIAFSAGAFDGFSVAAKGVPGSAQPALACTC